jgi:hypothetical protein
MLSQTGDDEARVVFACRLGDHRRRIPITQLDRRRDVAQHALHLRVDPLCEIDAAGLLGFG